MYKKFKSRKLKLQSHADFVPLTEIDKPVILSTNEREQYKHQTVCHFQYFGSDYH